MWCEVTGSPVGFWTATPRMLANAVAGALERARTDQRARAWAAWTTALLGRVTQFPDLSEVAGDAPAAPVRPQTPTEQLSILSAWAARNSQRE